jgi:hypothetical protein
MAERTAVEQRCDYCGEPIRHQYWYYTDLRGGFVQLFTYCSKEHLDADGERAPKGPHEGE